MSYYLERKPGKNKERVDSLLSFLKKTVAERPSDDLPVRTLTLSDTQPLSWDKAYLTLFGEGHSAEAPMSDIEKIMVDMHQFLDQPIQWIPYLQKISDRLDIHWEKIHPGKAFPTFDVRTVTFWSHQSLGWPMPTESYLKIKKYRLLQKILLSELRRFNMGEQTVKFTGFIEKEVFNNLLEKNAFFTENRLDFQGLFHGNMHNLQRVILLLWLEETLKLKDIKPEVLFSHLVKINNKSGKRLWNPILDTTVYHFVTGRHPQRMHSLILCHADFPASLRSYMLHSFCAKFLQFRDFYQEVFNRKTTSEELVDHFSCLQPHLFMKNDWVELLVQGEEIKLCKREKFNFEVEEKACRLNYITTKSYEDVPESKALLRHVQIDSVGNNPFSWFSQQGKRAGMLLTQELFLPRF